MKLFIVHDPSNNSYKVSYHKCEEPGLNSKRFVIYKSYLIDHHETGEFGHFFFGLLERKNACNCWRNYPNKKAQSVEISASEYRRIRNKK